MLPSIDNSYGTGKNNKRLPVLGDSRLKLILPGTRSGISHSTLEVIKIIFEFGKKNQCFLYIFF